MLKPNVHPLSMTISQRLHTLLEELQRQSLTLDDVHQRLSPEAEAVARLEAEELKARQALLMVRNHHLAGVPIYAHVANLAEGNLPRPVDGNTPHEPRGH